MTHLFETFLSDGFGVDLNLEDDGIGLAHEAPHISSSLATKTASTGETVNRYFVTNPVTVC